MCEIMDRWVNEVKAEGERIGYQNGEKAGYANGEKAGYANGEKAGYANGEKAGYANGEKVSAMRTCLDFGKSKSETAAYLTKTLHLSMDEAAKAVEDYWDASKQANRA